MTEDEWFEELPPHLRREALKHWQGESTDPIPVTVHREPLKANWLVIVLAFLFAIPGTLLGLAICFTVIFIPLGIAIVGGSCAPLSFALASKFAPKKEI